MAEGKQSGKALMLPLCLKETRPLKKRRETGKNLMEEDENHGFLEAGVEGHGQEGK